MDKQVSLAIYKNLDMAHTVIDNLLAMGLERSTIGLALHDDTGRDGRALVTVTIDDEQREAVKNTLDAHNPLKLDTREVQWRQEGESEMTPDETTFVALPLSR